MKAVATALVLIVGAAVVLWYGNTLNSWVLGGLIGGLAALLISIPISLTLFSYLSRHHDDVHEEEFHERISLAQISEYQDDDSAMPYPDEVEGSLYPVNEELWDGQAERFRSDRYAPGFSSSEQQRAAMTRSHTLKKLPAPRHSPNIPASRQLPPVSNTLPPDRHTTRRLPTTYTLSEHRSQALRAARKEAAQQFDDVIEKPSRTARFLPAERPVQPRPAHLAKPRPPVTKRASRQLNPRPANVYPKQTHQRSNENSTTRHSAPLSGRETGPVYTDRQLQGKDLARDHQDYYPRTEPIDRPTQAGRMRRDTRLHGQNRDAEITTEGLQKPLVRRPPYMYEDDPIRQEFSQYSDNPIVRRSSRYDPLQEDDQEQ